MIACYLCRSIVRYSMGGVAVLVDSWHVSSQPVRIHWMSRGAQHWPQRLSNTRHSWTSLSSTCIGYLFVNSILYVLLLTQYSNSLSFLSRAHFVVPNCMPACRFHLSKTVWLKGCIINNIKCRAMKKRHYWNGQWRMQRRVWRFTHCTLWNFFCMSH